MTTDSAPPSEQRRQLLQALAGAGALGLAGGSLAATGAPTVTAAEREFTALAGGLTGFPPPSPDVAAKMYRAFATPARRAQLAALARAVATTPAAELDAVLKNGGLAALANELTSAWFSGIVNGPKGQQVVLYVDAYMWNSMTFSKPMGQCGGALGYWATPPA